MWESVVDLLVTAFPGLQGFFDTAEIYITAIPAWGMAASTFLILAIGGVGTLWHFGYLRELFGGGWRE